MDAGSLPDGFLTVLVAEVDGPHVEALILSGSHALGGATAFSDVDLGMVLAEDPPGGPRKELFYRQGHLVSVAMRPMSWWRGAMARPEQAVFYLIGLRDARLLIDRNNQFARFQDELRAFDWDPLQQAADDYVSASLVGMAEVAHKLLSARARGDSLSIFEGARALWYELTRLMVIGRGMPVESSARYLTQAQEAAGVDSAWTHWHRAAAGIDAPPTNEQRGSAALRLYVESIAAFAPSMTPHHRRTVQETVSIIERALCD
jgi:predicted nucleotidyltransferase